MPLTLADCQKAITETPDGVRKVPDGHGLFLFIKNGRASWTYQHRSGDGWTSKGLGPFPAVTPKQAREAAEAYRVALRSGAVTLAPRAPRADSGKLAGVPYARAVSEWLAVAAVKWADKTRAATERALVSDLGGRGIFPAAKPVNTITTQDCLDVLLPLPERQRQDVRQNLARVLDFAIGRHWMTEPNPAKFEGPRRELWPRFNKSDKHHAAIAWADLPDTYKALPTDEAGRALRFLILTACRAGELEKATWAEITEERNGHVIPVWKRPADHMKLGKEHSIPLTADMMALLGERGEPDSPLFSLPSNAMLNTLKKVRPDATVHGLRSTFADWCGDNGKDRDLREMQLAHLVGNSVERAYSRSDWLLRRRVLLEQWAAFATA
jgi:integrase